MMGGGGGGGGPDPVAIREQRVREAQRMADSIFGIPGETDAQFRSRSRKDFLDKRRPMVRTEGTPAQTGIGGAVTVPATPATSRPDMSWAPGVADLQAADAFVSGMMPGGVRRFSPEWYDGQRRAYTDNYTPELERQRQQRQQQEAFWLWRQGLGQSTEAGKAFGNVERVAGEGRQKIAQGGQQFVNDLKGRVEKARRDVIETAAGGDLASAGRLAGEAADIVSRPPAYEPAADFFSGLVSPAAILTTAAIRNGSESPSRGMVLGRPGGVRTVGRL